MTGGDRERERDRETELALRKTKKQIGRKSKEKDRETSEDTVMYRNGFFFKRRKAQQDPDFLRFVL
jgi:hypothetical protein